MPARRKHDYQSVLDEYNKTKDVPSCALALGLSKHYVRRAIRGCGEEPEKHSWRVYPPNHKINDNDLIRSLFLEQQMPVSQISLLIQADEQAVRKKIQSLGFPLRGRSEEQRGIATMRGAVAG